MSKIELTSDEKDYLVDRIIEDLGDFMDRYGNLDAWENTGLRNTIDNIIDDINSDRSQYD
jgi:hypothetical protein